MTLQITQHQSHRQPPLKSNLLTMLRQNQPSGCVLLNLFWLLKPQPHDILLVMISKPKLCIVQIVELVKNKAVCPQP
jgi:hypothetical protein